MNVQASIPAERVAGILMRLELAGLRVENLSQLVHLALQVLEERFGEALRPDPVEAQEFFMRYKPGGFGRKLRAEDMRSLGRYSQTQMRQEMGASAGMAAETRRVDPRAVLSPEAMALLAGMGLGEPVEAKTAEQSEAPGDSLDVDRSAGEAPGGLEEIEAPVCAGESVGANMQATLDALGFKRPSPLFTEVAPPALASPGERKDSDARNNLVS